MKNSRDNDISNKRNKHLSIFSDYKSFCKERVSLTRNTNEEINISQSDLEYISPIILKKLNKLNPTEKETRLHLPSTITTHSLNLYIQALKRKSFKIADLNECKELLKVTDFFQDKDTATIIINESMINLIDKNNCLEILEEYIGKVYSKESEKSIYLGLVQAGIEQAYKNIFFLLNNQYDQLIEINIDTIEAVIERYFENVVFKEREDYMQIIDLIAKKRNLHNVFDLLENERKLSIIKFNNFLSKGNCEPFLVWKVISDNPSVGYYKESEPFSFENVNNYEFVIINYYNTESDTCSIAIKVSEMTKDNELGLNLSLLSVIRIKEINYESKVNFNCMVLDLKSKVLLCKIENFSSLFSSNGIQSQIEFTIEIFFNLSYNFSAILSHICRNFYMYNSLGSISKLSKNLLSLILKNSHLNVKNEDEKLNAIKNWRSGKDEKICTGEELYRTINWDNLSLDALLEFIINDAKTLLNSSELQKILVREFQRRFRSELYQNRKKNLTQDIKGNHSFVEEPAPPSFTSELISKLIKIASRYETISKPNFPIKSSKLSKNNSLVFNKDKTFCKSSNKLEKDSIDNSQNLVHYIDPTEKKSDLQTLNDFSFIAKTNSHKRNFSNSNNYDILNDTFKNLSNNLSIKKTMNKSYNISPNRKFNPEIIIEKRKEKFPTSVKKVVYTTTQTNINSTNNNSYLATENKCNTNPPLMASKNTNTNKITKMPAKPKKKKDEKINISNVSNNLVNSIKPNENMKKCKFYIEKLKQKVAENNYINANCEPRPKSVSLIKMKQELFSNKKLNLLNK